MHNIPVVYRKCLNRAVALAAVIGFLLICAPPSLGVPGEAIGVADSPTLPLTDLGFDSTLQFWGLDDTQELTLPVLHGLTPVSLNATVQLPINLRSGMLAVTQDQRDIARLNLPLADEAPIVIPLQSAKVVDDSVIVDLHAYLSSVDGGCLHAASPLRLINATISYAGVEQPPNTIAHFMPPVLHKLTIYLPEAPSIAESDAAVRLATAVYAHYGSQAPQIAVLSLPKGQLAPTTSPGPMERQVVVKEGPDIGLSLQGTAGVPWLLISGPLWQTNESDTAVLFGDLSRLSLSAKVSPGPVNVAHKFPGDTTTLRELGQPSLNATGLRPRVFIGLDQTRMGRSVQQVQLHLQGSYSPIPANSAGEIVAKIGSETIDHWPTDGQGGIDRTIDIPDRLLQRYTSLEVMFNVAGNAGRCGDFYVAGPGDHLLTLTVNGDSTVHSKPAAPPVPDGLKSMPQALMPHVQVGIEPRSLEDTVRAVTIMEILQRMSSVPINTVVTTVQQALDSTNPSVLVAADGWNNSDITLPVSASQSGPLTVNAVQVDGKPTSLALDPQLRFSSLQTVFYHGRSLLIATSNGIPAQLDELLRWLNSDPDNWPRLSGVAVISVPGQDPVTVDHLNVTGPGVAGQDNSAHFGWLWLLGGGWLAVAAVGAAILILRSRVYR